MELDKAMKEFVELKAQIKELKERKEELRTEILIDIKVKDIITYDTDEVKLRFITQKRKSFNKDLAITKLEAHGEDVNAFFTESDYEILKIDSNNVKEVN